MGEGTNDRQVRAEVIVETAISPFCVIDPDGTITWAGDSIAELVGWKPTDLVGRNMAEFLERESLNRAVEMLRRFQTTGQVSSAWRGSGITVELLDVDGLPVPCDMAVATPVRTGLDGFVLQFRRRGGGAHLQRALTAMAENLPMSRVLASMASALAVEIADARAELHWDWNGSGFGAASSSDGLSLLADDRASEGGRRPWVEAIETGSPVGIDDLDELPATVGRVARQLALTSLWVQPAAASGARPSAVAAVWRSGAPDPSLFPSYEVDRLCSLTGLALEWDRGRSSLRFAANHDPLTGLANRRTLLERLRSPVGLGAEGTVLFCDVDDFKPVNDEHGHASGDAVLQVIGERLRQAVRPSDLVARYGGDEFVVHCPGTTDGAVVTELIDRLIRATSEPITIGAMTVQVGLSVGRSSIVTGADVDDVLAAAARDMGDVKRRRKLAAPI